MDDQEIMVRAREAAIAAFAYSESTAVSCRNGYFDDSVSVKAFTQALRDLSKPLSEIQPVEPDLLEARKLAREIMSGERDGALSVIAALAGIKRGRELAAQEQSR